MSDHSKNFEIYPPISVPPILEHEGQRFHRFWYKGRFFMLTEDHSGTEGPKDGSHEELIKWAEKIWGERVAGFTITFPKELDDDDE